MSGQTSEALLSLFDSARLRPRYWINFSLLSLIYPDSLKIRIGSCQSLGRRFYLRDDSRRLSRQRIAA
jgi:hypothetical protein